MPAPAPAQRVREIIGPVVTGAGLYLEEIEVARAGARSVVRIVLDLDEDATGGLSLDRIADVSREISAALDAADVFPGESTLEVSSPGVSRPLTERRHFARARGRLVTVHVVDGPPVTGRLVSVVGDGPGTMLLVVPEPVSVKGRPPVAAPSQEIALGRVRHGEVEVELTHLAHVSDEELFGAGLDDTDDTDEDTPEDAPDEADPQDIGGDAAGNDAGAPATKES